QPAGPPRAHRNGSPPAFRHDAWRGARVHRRRVSGPRRDRHNRDCDCAGWLFRERHTGHGVLAARRFGDDYEWRTASAALGAAARAANGGVSDAGRAAAGIGYTAGSASAQVTTVGVLTSASWSVN